jgi:hypothetical protein
MFFVGEALSLDFRPPPAEKVAPTVVTRKLLHRKIDYTWQRESEADFSGEESITRALQAFDPFPDEVVLDPVVQKRSNDI